MATDPDAMWKPGFEPDASPAEVATEPPPADPDADVTASDTPPETGADTVGATSTTLTFEPPPEPVSRSSRSWRWLGAAGALALVGGASLVWALTRGGDDDAADVGEIAAADERRLPTTVTELWTTRFPGTGTALATNLAIDGRDLIVAVVDDGSRDRTSVIALDADSGGIRWRRSFSFAPPEVRIIAIDAGVVILEQVNPSSRQMFALDALDGVKVWEREPTSDAFSVVLDGTAVIAQVITPEFPGVGHRALRASETVFVDPTSGIDLGTAPGGPLSTDLAGTWYFGDRTSVVSIDLSAGWTEPVEESSAGIGSLEQLGVVDDRLLVVSASGNIAELGADSDISIQDLTLLAAPRDGDIPVFTSVFPAGGTRFVGVGNGVVAGAELESDDVRSTWEMQASMRGFALTERGLVLALSDAGAGFIDGAELVVVEAVTGERLAAAGPAPDTERLPLIVGDGFVMIQSTFDTSDRVAYDLDGAELWRLPTAGTLRVGDGLVVTLQNTPHGYEVTAHGDPV